MSDVLKPIGDKFHSVPESSAGKHWLYWISMLAAGLTVAHVLRQIHRGKGV